MARVAIDKNELKFKFRLPFRFLWVITLLSKKNSRQIGNTNIFNKLVLVWKNSITPTLELW